MKKKDFKQPCNVYGISCCKRYAETSKTIGGYDQINSMPRALGFEDLPAIQNKLDNYIHLINANDVVVVCKWLFKNGYDVVKLNTRPKRKKYTTKTVYIKGTNIVKCTKRIESK